MVNVDRFSGSTAPIFTGYPAKIFSGFPQTFPRVDNERMNLLVRLPVYTSLTPPLEKKNNWKNGLIPS